MNDFRLNDALVRPGRNEIERAGRSERLSGKFIDLLVVLAERPGETIAKQELLRRVWNDPLAGDEALTHAVWMLRKVLNDNAKQPQFIETIPRRGYRLVAIVRLLSGPSAALPATVDLAGPMAATITDTATITSVRERRSAARRPLWLRLAAAALMLFAIPLTAGHWIDREPSPASALMTFRSDGAVTTLAAPTHASLILATEPGTLHAIDALSGTERWRFDAGQQPMLAPGINPSRIFVGGDDGYTYAIDARSGEELWRHAAGCAVRTAPVRHQDRVVFADCRGHVFAIASNDAKPLWRVALESPALGGVLDFSDALILRTLDGSVVALDPADGSKRWWRPFGAHLSELVAVDATQLVFASAAGQLVSLDARDGSLLWQADLHGAGSAPVVDGDRIYAIGRFGNVIALRSCDGSVVWRTPLEVHDSHAPLVWHDRLVVVMQDGALALIDSADGQRVQRIALYEDIDALAVEGERLIVATRSGSVFALERALLSGAANRQSTLGPDGRLSFSSKPRNRRWPTEA